MTAELATEKTSEQKQPPLNNNDWQQVTRQSEAADVGLRFANPIHSLLLQTIKKLALLVRQIGWSHNMVVVERCSDPLEREFYIYMIRKYSERELERALIAKIEDFLRSMGTLAVLLEDIEQ